MTSVANNLSKLSEWCVAEWRRNRIIQWFFYPPFGGLPFLLWFYVCWACIIVGGGAFIGELAWFDDNIRMLRVFDFINGAGWYDNLITRANAPEGYLSGWSRLVDLPLAAIVLIFKPYLGQMQAGLVASIILPLFQVLLLFFCGGYMARPLVGKKYARLVSLFIVFTSAIRPETFTLAGFQIGNASHHAWYVLLCMAQIGSLARFFDKPKMKHAVLAAGCAAMGLAIGIEPIPFVMGTIGFLQLYFMLTRDTVLFRFIFAYIAYTLLFYAALLLTHQPPSHYFDVTYFEASFLGVLLLSVALVHTVSLQWAVKFIRTQHLFFICGAVVGCVLWAGFLVQYPEMLHGGMAALSLEERALVIKETPELMPLHLVAVSLLDNVRLLAPMVIALVIGLIAVLQGGINARARAKVIFYTFILALAVVLALKYSRYYHYAGLFATPLLLLGALQASMAFRRDTFHALKVALLFLGVAPLWQVLVPAAISDRSFYRDVLLFPSYSQSPTGHPCNAMNIGLFLDKNYSPNTTIIVPPYMSSKFLFHSKLNVFYLAFFPAQNKHIEANKFYQTTDPEVAHDIALRGGIDLVAVCGPIRKDSEAAVVMSPAGASPDTFDVQLRKGNAPAWLKPIDVVLYTNYLLYEVVKPSSGAPQNK